MLQTVQSQVWLTIVLFEHAASTMSLFQHECTSQTSLPSRFGCVWRNQMWGVGWNVFLMCFDGFSNCRNNYFDTQNITKSWRVGVGVVGYFTLDSATLLDGKGLPVTPLGHLGGERAHFCHHVGESWTGEGSFCNLSGRPGTRIAPIRVSKICRGFRSGFFCGFLGCGFRCGFFRGFSFTVAVDFPCVVFHWPCGFFCGFFFSLNGFDLGAQNMEHFDLCGFRCGFFCGFFA